MADIVAELRAGFLGMAPECELVLNDAADRIEAQAAIIEKAQRLLSVVKSAAIDQADYDVVMARRWPSAQGKGSMNNRRDRLICFIEPWFSTHPQYRPRIGDVLISLYCLTDATLERLAARIVQDFWFTRHINRENRRISRMRVAGSSERAQA